MMNGVTLHLNLKSSEKVCYHYKIAILQLTSLYKGISEVLLII